MAYDNAIEAALKYVAGIAEQDVAVAQTTGRQAGRPSNKRLVNGVVLTREEYDVYLALRKFWDTAKSVALNQGILTDEEFVAFMKAAAPMLNKRMIDMALVSDDLKEVRQVAAELANRGYGKAASQININISDKDIRGAWAQVGKRDDIDVSNLLAAAGQADA